MQSMTNKDKEIAEITESTHVHHYSQCDYP
jgi:hypothetical protein